MSKRKLLVKVNRHVDKGTNYMKILMMRSLDKTIGEGYTSSAGPLLQSSVKDIVDVYRLINFSICCNISKLNG